MGRTSRIGTPPCPFREAWPKSSPELEHATIPPYMCALYSLDPDRNTEAGHVVGAVLIEEMPHLALAANLLNAVGDSPRTDTPELLPAYLHPLPHGDRSSALPAVLDLSFNGEPCQLKEAVGVMCTLRARAVALMRLPNGDGRTTAGPTFEYVPIEQRT